MLRRNTSGSRHELHVLGRDPVGDLDHLRLVLGHDHLAKGFPRLAGDGDGREDLQ